MDYASARAVLDRLPTLEVKPGLDRVGRLLDGLGHPERAYPAVHVAGTNGKGSVVAMLDAVLRCAGRSVGRFTSPQVVDFRDRVVVDGAWLSEDEWAAGVERLAPLLASMEDRPAQFEAITALTLDAFARHAVDVAVVEVGLGGRFDATNLVRPILTILTNVDLDHTALLGDSVEAIAWEKVGIAKAGVPLLVGPLVKGPLAIARRECEAVGAEFVLCDGVSLERVSEIDGVCRYRVGGDGLPEAIDLPLLGGYQAGNLRMVLRAVQLLRDWGVDLPSRAVEDGLRTVSWPGRFEIVRTAPTVILEGAHNVAGATALAADIAHRVPDPAGSVLVFAALADKDVSGMLRALAPHFGRVILTRSASPRALSVDRLAAIARALGIPFTCYDSVEGVLADALGEGAPEDVWVVAGSLTVVAEARRWLEETG